MPEAPLIDDDRIVLLGATGTLQAIPASSERKRRPSNRCTARLNP